MPHYVRSLASYPLPTPMKPYQVSLLFTLGHSLIYFTLSIERDSREGTPRNIQGPSIIFQSWCTVKQTKQTQSRSARSKTCETLCRRTRNDVTQVLCVFTVQHKKGIYKKFNRVPRKSGQSVSTPTRIFYLLGNYQVLGFVQIRNLIQYLRCTRPAFLEQVYLRMNPQSVKAWHKFP